MDIAKTAAWIRRDFLGKLNVLYAKGMVIE